MACQLGKRYVYLFKYITKSLDMDNPSNYNL